MKFEWVINDFPIKKWEKEKVTFKGNWVYNWFSNMIEMPIIIDNELYGSSEQYYQSNKPLDFETHCLIKNSNPYKAKQLAKRVIRNDWEDVKFNIMFKGLYHKCIQHPAFLKELKKYNHIIEWNNWNDTTWGVSIKTLEGRNAFGEMLNYLKENLN